MSWNALPTELHLALVHLLPLHDVLALSTTSPAVRALCLPAIFANVALPDARSLAAFARHVPTSYGAYVKSLAITTAGAIGATDHVLAVLDACTRVQTLSLSLASSIDPAQLVPAFSRLHHVHSCQIGCAGREDVSPVSERLVVALAASLSSLTHLSLTRITRSAIHVDPCDVPFGVPIVTNDVDVPLHPLLGTDLSLPNLLRLPTLRTLEIRDTWMGCDTKIDTAASLDKLVLTGSMYASDVESEAQACTAWLQACSPLRSLELGTALAPAAQATPVRVSHVHINASRITIDDLPMTLEALQSSDVESITIAYEQSEVEKRPLNDDFARECALEDLEDWRAAVEGFLLERSTDEWRTLARIEVSFGHGVDASWDL